MTLENQYAQIKLDVESFSEKFQADPKMQPSIKKHFKGVQMLFSPLTKNPKIMFIGINPGAGFFDYEKRNVKRYNPLKTSEYTHGAYRLAQQTRKLFDLAGLTKEDLANSVKTNCFFFATRNEKELYQFLSHLKESNVYLKSAKWLDEIVSLIQPKVIICEGKSAFDRFVKGKGCEITDDGKVLFTTWNNIKIIGYRRNFSNVVEIENVASKLNKVVNE